MRKRWRSTSRAWLLVYGADPGDSGERWLDKGNDPEMRGWPMTWGICRTDTRLSARVGDDLFFVAFAADRPPDDSYYLTAQFRIAEKIQWPDAVRRFGGRPNIIIDDLPPGRDIGERVVNYAVDHRNALRWDGVRRKVLNSLGTDAEWLRGHADEFVVTLAGQQYVHAYYDGHTDWRTRRLDGPYVVADTVASRIVADPIPYAALAAECADLVPPERLRTTGRQPRHPRRLLNDSAAAHLHQVVRQALSLEPARWPASDIFG